MKPVIGIIATLIALTATMASSQVTGVVTDSSATLKFRPGIAPGDTGIHTFSGPQISGSLGSNIFGSGGVFASTSRVDPDDIEFQNGNASGGFYTSVLSHTAVDISFTNDGSSALVPRLRSTIVPAGLGLFVDGACLDDFQTCGPGHDFPGDVRGFQDFRPAHSPSASDAIAGASFDFRVSSGGTTIYTLSGSLALVRDEASGTNILVTDFGAASAALTGFRLTSPTGSQSEFGIAWDATALDIGFPPGTLLAPGESATLTYETTVESFSRTLCFQPSTAACLVAYSSFGDPVGRGGGIRPTLPTATASKPLSFDTFSFGDPELRDGVLHFELLSPPSVVEPSTWAMMITGFGLVGAIARRRAISDARSVL
jgi:hypothetical protein